MPATAAPKMLAFKNTVHTKKSAVALARMHYDADHFEKGHYEFKKGKACSIGCMTNEYVAKEGGDRHKATEALFGIPRALSYLQDRIFEGLPVEDSKVWTVRLMEAIPSGADLSTVVSRLMLWLMTDPEGIIKHARPDGLKAIKAVAKLYKARLAGKEPTPPPTPPTPPRSKNTTSA